METTSKERILKKIRKALTRHTPQPFPNVEVTNPVFKPQADDLEVIFAEEFSKIQGKFIYDIKDGLQMLQQKYEDDVPSMIILATGPSRTADIEKTLVLGAHGPKEVYVFLIDDSGAV